MIKPILLLLLILRVFSINAQVDVPTIVIEDMQDRFSSLTNIKWQHDRFGYQARFIQDNQDNKVIYLKSGVRLETITEISFEDLTINVKELFNSEYKTFQIRQVLMIETTDFFGFELSLYNKENELRILVRDNGELFSEEY